MAREQGLNKPTTGGELGSYAGIPIIRSKFLPKEAAVLIGTFGDGRVIILSDDFQMRPLKRWEIVWMWAKRCAYIVAFGWSGAPYAPKKPFGRFKRQ